MIMYGEFDIYNNEYNSIYSRFEQSNNLIIKNAGHLPWIQNSVVFYSELDNFYKESSNEK